MSSQSQGQLQAAEKQCPFQHQRAGEASRQACVASNHSLQWFVLITRSIRQLHSTKTCSTCRRSFTTSAGLRADWSQLNLSNSKICPTEYRTLVNKLFPWSIGLHAQRDGTFTTARELDGKIVCTHDGLTVAGLRIYRGTTAHALFIDVDGDAKHQPQRQTPPPKSSVIKTLPAGTIDNAITFRCVRHDRTVTFKGAPVQAFTVEDSSTSVSQRRFRDAGFLALLA
ncbi:argonaute-like protein, putative [Bodo saltans]|uniref:Argonaute-like protein, putative n=1 Tax=Bodo saltans TaxID=75058 RepID=A0A0S4J498_BODSA|nr:argonaute-like protein, putative [Bodo saltans]|eukprot:CUG75108.1 argonaute-like protein, putative [Bodo saltans]